MPAIILSFVLLLSGCVTAQVVRDPAPQRMALHKTENTKHIHHITSGMSKKDVQAILKSSITVGVTKKENDWEPITLNNPYREEAFIKKNKRYDIHYYVTHIYKQDGFISEQELTPVIFFEDNVIGVGKQALKQLKM